MAKKSKKPGGEGPARSPFYALFARIRPELGVAWEEYLASLRPKPKAVSAIEDMMEDFLGRKGFWPRDAQEGQS